MSHTIYTITYQDIEIARVRVDDTPEVEQDIKEMVEFWGGWQQCLKDAHGSYIRVWLRKLGMFIMYENRAPNTRGYDDEGWYAMDGSRGIMLLNVWPYDYDESEIDWVVEKS